MVRSNLPGHAATLSDSEALQRKLRHHAYLFHLFTALFRGAVFYFANIGMTFRIMRVPRLRCYASKVSSHKEADGLSH